MHVDVMTDFVRTLDLHDTTFFGQDWGGLIGLRVVAEEPGLRERLHENAGYMPIDKGVAIIKRLATEFMT